MSENVKPSKTDNSGFTLVELIASLVLAGIVAVALTTFVVTAVNSFLLSKNASEISHKAQLTITRIRAELLAADSVNPAESNANKIVFENGFGIQTVERLTDSVQLNGHVLTNGIQNDYYTESGNDFITYAQSEEGSWTITLTLKYSENNTVFQTTINPRANTLRNAPKLVYYRAVPNMTKHWNRLFRQG